MDFAAAGVSLQARLSRFHVLYYQLWAWMMRDKEYFHMYEEEESHWWYVGMRFIVSALLPPGKLPPNPLVLDAGCGTGYNLGWLRRTYDAVTIGIDYSPLALQLCRRRKEKALIQADAARLPFADAVFDLVVSLDVMTHLDDKAARCQALQEFRRVLKPRSLILLRVAAHKWLRSSHDDAIETRHRYSKSELREETIEAGFQPQRITYANTILFPGAVVWRILKKARLAPAGSDVCATTRLGSRLNQWMTCVLKLEAAILRRTRWNFPFGLSIFILADKP